MISRREALRMGGLALAGSSFLPSAFGQVLRTSQRTNRLFFDVSDIPRIRASARSVLLEAKYQEWALNSPQSVPLAWDKFAASGNIIYDLRDFWAVFEQTALVHIVEPTVERRQVLLDGIENVLNMPKWDYMMDGEEDIGLMRAAMAISRLLFAREALGDDFSDDLNERLLDAIAEKGAVPCFRTIQDMNHPEQATGWHFDPEHPKINDYSLERWPWFLGNTNLRCTPTMGLGLAALALGDRDSRSKEWLDTAVDSAYSGFDLFSEGGSYFEGLSYASYAMRLLLQFCEAHYRVNGTVNWTNAVNWSGFVENVAAMQAGSKADGTPDVVNFSDASASIHPCVGSWIRERTGNPLAQYAAKNFGAPGYFLDFLWYRPLESSRPPREVLKNYHDDLDWIICRSGWEADDAVLAFRSGDPANHEHADRNSFLYKIYGERLLNDHFGAAYERRDPKWTLRMTKAHNAVLIGGRGHQYHEGEEGVNEGQAEAEVVKFVDEGERVWWCSDATHAYQLVNENVSKVLRTVVFAKPNIIVVLDQVDLKSVAEEVEIRFFPDNRDEQAGVEVEESGFSITRPKASLHSHVASSSTLLLSSSKLDPIEDFLSKESVDDKRAGEIRYEFGNYPFVRVRSSSAKEHAIVTVLVAQSHDVVGRPAIDLNLNKNGWRFSVNGVEGFIDTTGVIPDVQ